MPDAAMLTYLAVSVTRYAPCRCVFSETNVGPGGSPLSRRRRRESSTAGASSHAALDHAPHQAAKRAGQDIRRDAHRSTQGAAAVRDRNIDSDQVMSGEDLLGRDERNHAWAPPASPKMLTWVMLTIGGGPSVS
jgi:hypothetical protein